jgi:hypothetical protein
MSGNGADGVLWAKIRHTAGCEESAAEDAAVLEEQEEAAQVRVAQQLGEYAGLGRGPGWVSQPGWISDSESELDRIARFAIDPDDCEGVLWEAFKDLEEQSEQQRFRLFVQGCAGHWMAVAEEAAGVAQEEDTGASQAGDEQEAGDEQGSDDSITEMTCVLVEQLAWNVTAEMLQGTFKQIGHVVHAEMGGDGWGWVEFEHAEDAEDAVQRFGGVELAGQPMWCSRTHSG